MHGQGLGMGRRSWKSLEVLTKIQALDQQPFREEAAKWLGLGPSDEAIRGLAEKDPTRWMAGLNLMARLGGFHEKQLAIREANITVNVAAMSDAEIALRLEQLQAEVFGDGKVIDGDVIDGELVDSGAGSGSGSAGGGADDHSES